MVEASVGHIRDLPKGAAIIVDINEAGSTIMTTNKLSIDATEKTSTTAATAAALTDTSIADDAEAQSRRGYCQSSESEVDAFPRDEATDIEEGGLCVVAGFCGFNLR